MIERTYRDYSSFDLPSGSHLDGVFDVDHHQLER
jgi:hypothetical protein